MICHLDAIGACEGSYVANGYVWSSIHNVAVVIAAIITDRGRGFYEKIQWYFKAVGGANINKLIQINYPNKLFDN